MRKLRPLSGITFRRVLGSGPLIANDCRSLIASIVRWLDLSNPHSLWWDSEKGYVHHHIAAIPVLSIQPESAPRNLVECVNVIDPIKNRAWLHCFNVRQSLFRDVRYAPNVPLPALLD